MKTLKFIGTAIFAIALSGNFTSCSDVDEGTSSSNNETSQYDDEILGLWECVETTSDNSETTGSFYVGEKIKFFSGEFSYEDPEGLYVLKGKKCFLSNYWHDNNFLIETTSTTVTDPTEEQWNQCVDMYDDGSAEFEHIYTLSRDSLTIIECDLDRWLGTFSIEGDELTFSYYYQNWKETTALITEVNGPYTSTFKRK